ncbi:MAG: hypothetical protein OEQ30_07145 [Gammaproteobacteria bacterium]|jgi:hypothetical protein|nr:hypothetical protein [Gammaproteobacteria bacterium]MDH3757443.1 hypothetical protein [Gammaproteobacteria bacterium]MDH3847604.1 hypothetical protein [Gammaproteobacteria bacterium]MDH3865135.1 hypothetical protein [Gammaproteobacteria bacterium]MDH3904275.1 hypothetical protein [Gammaproteobacteria bacterium]
MFKSIGTLTVICSLCLGAAQTASAHDRAYERHELPRHHHVSIYRDRYMPQWLSYDRGFRLWYHRTSLRHNHHLAWWQLHEIYSWERRYNHRRHHAVHYGARHHDYDWYRHYWRKHDRHHDDRRRHSKRKYRDESRYRARRDSRRHHDDD